MRRALALCVGLGLAGAAWIIIRTPYGAIEDAKVLVDRVTTIIPQNESSSESGGMSSGQIAGDICREQVEICETRALRPFGKAMNAIVSCSGTDIAANLASISTIKGVLSQSILGQNLADNVHLFRQKTLELLKPGDDCHVVFELENWIAMSEVTKILGQPTSTRTERYTPTSARIGDMLNSTIIYSEYGWIGFGPPGTVTVVRVTLAR